MCWDIITQIYSEDGIEYQLSQKLNMLSQYGFTVVPYELSNGSFLVENEYQAIIDILQQESKNKSYPIVTPVYAVTYENNPNPNVDILINWILSDEGQYIIEQTGYVGINP